MLTVTHLVDIVSDGEQIKSLGGFTKSFFLQQSDNQRSRVVLVTFVSIDYRDTVLGISPERVCQTHLSVIRPPVR